MSRATDHLTPLYHLTDSLPALLDLCMRVEHEYVHRHADRETALQAFAARAQQCVAAWERGIDRSAAVLDRLMPLYRRTPSCDVMPLIHEQHQLLHTMQRAIQDAQSAVRTLQFTGVPATP